MAAVAARSHCNASRDNGSLEPKIPLPKTGSDEKIRYISTEWMWRCASSCIERDLAYEDTPAETSVRILDSISALCPLFLILRTGTYLQKRSADCFTLYLRRGLTP